MTLRPMRTDHVEAESPWAVFLKAYNSKHPANTRYWANVASMLAHRLRRWPNMKPTLAQCLMFARIRAPTWLDVIPVWHLRFKLLGPHTCIPYMYTCTLHGSDRILRYFIHAHKEPIDSLMRGRFSQLAALYLGFPHRSPRYKYLNHFNPYKTR